MIIKTQQTLVTLIKAILTFYIRLYEKNYYQSIKIPAAGK
jgi:hypothetical protein